MKLSQWIAARPELEERIEATVKAHKAFGDFVRGFQLSKLTSDEKIVEWKNEQQRLFRIFDDLKAGADAMMPPMEMISGIDGYAGGKGLSAENMDLLGWEFDEDFFHDPPKGHAALLKYREKGASVSFYTHHPDRVELKDPVVLASKEEFLSIMKGSTKELVMAGMYLYSTMNTLAGQIPTFFSGSLPKMQEVDQNILLIPYTWYDLIPDGFVLVDIFGKECLFVHGRTSDDDRGGYLAYGVLRDVEPKQDQ